MNFALMCFALSAVAWLALVIVSGARREHVRRRQDQRFCELLRKGIDNYQRTETQGRAGVVKWQSCETTSAPCSSPASS